MDQIQKEEYKTFKKLLFLVGLTIGKTVTSKLLLFLGFSNSEIKLR